MIRRWPNRSNGAAAEAAASIPFFVVVVGRRFVLSASVHRTSVLPKIEHVEGRTDGGCGTDLFYCGGCTNLHMGSPPSPPTSICVAPRHGRRRGVSASTRETFSDKSVAKVLRAIEGNIFVLRDTNNITLRVRKQAICC